MLELDEYLAAYPNPQAGPCALCGETNYSLSMGGPAICPSCDCQDPQDRVKELVVIARYWRERALAAERR